jgi:ParB-like chromosome segregation protein Spo0J
MMLKRAKSEIAAMHALSEADRVAAFNRLTLALRELVRDIADDPVLAVQLVPAESLRANAYNPNHVAAPELDLLELSIREDGVTMPVVVARDGEICEVVDGFHRQRVIRERLGRRYVPCSVIDRPLADRMASTVRHNRARGKHQVDLMGALVKSLLTVGWADARIAEHLGMSMEEILRLKQIVGVARLLAADEYSQSWGRVDEPDLPGE